MKKSFMPLVGRDPRWGAAASGLQGTAEPRVIEPARGWVKDNQGSLWMGGMIWLAIVILMVPADLLMGDPYASLAAEGAQIVQEIAEPNVLFRTIKLLMIAVSCLLIAWRLGFSWLLLKSSSVAFLFCLLLIPVSVLWSIDQDATIARSVTLGSLVLVSYVFVLVGWHPHRMQNVVRPILTFLLVASVLYGIFFPELAIEHGEGTLKDAWHGVTFQKNRFGLIASIGAVFWLHALFTKEKNTWLALSGVVLSVGCVLLSRSSSSLLSTVLTAGFMAVLLFLPGHFRRYMPYIVVIFAIIVVVYALAVLNVVPGFDVLLTPVADLFGKDTTFSNRSNIWAIIKEHIQLAPWLGTGYGAYWVGPVPTSPSYEFLGRMYFYPTESHNGYLEVINDLGYVGLTGCLLYLVSFVRQALEFMRVDRNQAVLYLCFFFQQAIVNLSESYWLQIGLGFTIMTMATFAMARASLDSRLQTYFGPRQPGAALAPR